MTDDTIVAVATAAGRGGIGIIRLSGTQSVDIAEQITQQDLPKPRYAARRGFFDPASSDSLLSTSSFLWDQARLIDSGLLLYFPSPHSYTGEAVIEFHLHGSPAALSLLLEVCTILGARLAEPGEFTKRAFLNQRLDLAQAEAVVDLINAASHDAARSAARSLSGAFSKQVQALSVALMEIRAQLEAGLDFADEDITFITHDQLTENMQSLSKQVNTLKAQAHQGVLLRDGVQCVLLGKVNVGKSSLLNALSGEEAAIVTDVPGTTRDSITRTVLMDGVPFHCVDTAGLRATNDPVEQMGIARTHDLVREADLIIHVRAFDIDGRLPPHQPLEMRREDSLDVPRINVINKSDYWQPSVQAWHEDDSLCVSAKTGDGLEKLRACLLAACGWEGGDHHDAGEQGVFMARSRHIAALIKAQQHIQSALDICSRATKIASYLSTDEEDIPVAWREEEVAEELRLAHYALQKIVGGGNHEDLLGEIFGRFCIGK